jgi:hypothetical protein
MAEQTTKQRIIGLLQESALTRDEIILTLSDKKPVSVIKRLSEMVDFGFVVIRDGKYRLCDTDSKQNLCDEVESLKKQIDYLAKRNKVTDYSFDGDILRFGVIADTHLGSIHDNLELLKSAYDIFEQEGIDKVFHVGDITDGEHMRPGHEYELKIIGFDSQVEYAVNEYPYRQGIETILLGGNHDQSFWKHSGADICLQIANKREDIKYMGMLEADFHFKTPNGNAILRMWHPLLGSAYAISYHVQKYIEALPGGAKPHILLVGNFHKYESIFYRNIHGIQPGCIQYQTSWMRGKRISAQLGFTILEFRINEDGVSRVKIEFFPDYSS